MIRFYFLNDAGSVEEFTERVNLAESSVALEMNAEQGTVGSSVIVVDDPLGDWNITGHRWVYVLEDDADPEMMYWGYAFQRDITRQGPNVLQSRKWSITVTDINTLLARRIMVGSDCNRPAETDVERITWLVGTTEQNFIHDTTFLSTDAPVALDAVDYRYQYATQIYDDCSQASGKNWYLYPFLDGMTWRVAFWYGSAYLTDYESDIRISNDESDVDYSTTFFAKLDTNLNRDPSRVYSGESMPFDGGTVYNQLAGTITAFANRDTSAPMVNVKTTAKANARSLRHLNTIKTEEDVITTGLYLPPAQVNDVLPGQRIEARFTHLPGYEAFSFMRVLKRTTTFLTPWLYDVGLTLSAEPQPSVPFPIPGDTNDGYLCTVDGYAVPWCTADGNGALTSTVVTQSGTSSVKEVKLYDGATYKLTWTAEHHWQAPAAGDNDLGGALGPGVLGFVGGELSASTNPQGTGSRYIFGSEFFGDPEYSQVFLITVGSAGDPCVPLWSFEGAGYFSLNSIGGIVTCKVTYVSGPDPRFEDLDPCPDPEWVP